MRDKILKEVKRIIQECIDSKHKTGFTSYDDLIKTLFIKNKLDEVVVSIRLNKKSNYLTINFNYTNYSINLSSDEIIEMTYNFNKLQKLSEELLLNDLKNINIEPLDITDIDLDNIG